MYNPESNKCFISRDVIFHEHQFPFAEPSSSYVAPISESPLSTTSLSEEPNPYPFTPDPSFPTSALHHFPPTFPDPLPSTDSSASHSHMSSTSSNPSSTYSDPLPVRRSDRPHNPPSYLQDYQCQLPAFFSYSSIQHLEFEPHTYAQAAPIPAWQDAMKKEFEALQVNNTWDIIELPPGKKPIRCK